MAGIQVSSFRRNFPHQLIRFKVGMLAPNLLSMSLDYLDRKSIINFAMTCRQARAFVMSYLHHCTEIIVKHFNLDPMRLNGLMLRCGAVISGECARLASMPVALSRVIHPPQLEFKTPRNSSQFFADQLLEMGEFRLDRKTKFYAQGGELSKKVWYIQHGDSIPGFKQEIHVISFADESLNPDHPYYGFFSYIPISISV